jgi:TatD DNase family protein
MSGTRGRLADTHCHLIAPEFDSDREAVLERARAAGIERILIPGLDLDSSRMAVVLADEHPEVFAAVGVHPHLAGEWDPAAEAELRSLAGSPGVVAIGEIGLDYVRNLAPAEVQRRAFRDQLDLAADVGLPVVVHNREATDDLMQELLAWSARLGPALTGRSGVLHAYSADLESASKAMAAGFYIGVAGPLTFLNANRRREITAQLPLERLVLETDSPYLAPHPHRGRRNEPSRVRLVAEALSALLGPSHSAVAQATARNASRLFRWDHGSDNSHLL